MYQKTYFVSKSTGTFADTLAAFGLAAILREVYEQANERGAGKKIRLRDAGPYYEIELPHALRAEWIENCSFFAPARPIRTAKQSVSEVETVWNLDEEWNRFRQFREAQDKLKKTAKSGAAEEGSPQAAIEDLRPSPEFWVMAFVGEWRMQALPIYNAAILQWHATREHLAENLKAILRLAAAPDTDLEIVAKEWSKALPKNDWKSEFTASQLFNPIQGKGQNRAKADALAMGNLKSFWLVEFLKAAGLWHCMAPRTVRNGDDRKVYVLSPIAMTVGAHEDVFKKFAERLWNDTAVKMDIDAALLYTEALLEHSEAGQEEDELDFERVGPENIVAGFYTATYKLLSRNAYTMMNLGFIGLPHWTGEVKTRERVEELHQAIKEHLEVIRSIDEERSDGYNLLVQYRDFLSGGQLETFFDFAIGYSQYFTHELEQGHFWVKKFTTPNLRRLIMGTEPQLIEILENEGFRNIAYAIRHSTVIPQYLRPKGDALYDVRYGLGMELKRKAAYPKEFLAALGNFIQEYNQENVQKVESKKQPQRRKNVRTSDIDEIVRLVDKFGSELICNLLVAYGYAGDPREETETQ
jgi:hypothetical protein